MKHFKQKLCFLMMLLLCMVQMMPVLAADDDTLRAVLSEKTEGKPEVQVVADTLVTDGVVTVTYDSTKLTYQNVTVAENCVAMYSVNAEEKGVVRISWVAPNDTYNGTYKADDPTAQVLTVNFTGTAGKDAKVELSGTTYNASGENVPVGKCVVVTDLEETVGGTDTLNKDDYTEESWKAYEEALKKAEEALKNAKTQEEVDKALKELNDAIAALKKVSDDKGNGSVQTGDNANIGLFAGLLAASAAVAVVVAVVIKKRRRAK